MKNVIELQAEVKDGVVISEQNGVVYADFVEDNADEFRLTQGNAAEVEEYLRNNGLLK